MQGTDKVRACWPPGTGLALSSRSPGRLDHPFVLARRSIAFIPLGVGVFTTPHVLRLVRRHANQRRLLAATWSGHPHTGAVPPLPDGPAHRAHRAGGAAAR